MRTNLTHVKKPTGMLSYLAFQNTRSNSVIRLSIISHNSSSKARRFVWIFAAVEFPRASAEKALQEEHAHL